MKWTTVNVLSYLSLHLSYIFRFNCKYDSIKNFIYKHCGEKLINILSIGTVCWLYGSANNFTDILFLLMWTLCCANDIINLIRHETGYIFVNVKQSDCVRSTQIITKKHPMYTALCENLLKREWGWMSLGFFACNKRKCLISIVRNRCTNNAFSTQ